jgi:hypothetical protein
MLDFVLANLVSKLMYAVVSLSLGVKLVMELE